MLWKQKCCSACVDNDQFFEVLIVAYCARALMELNCILKLLVEDVRFTFVWVCFTDNLLLQMLLVLTPGSLTKLYKIFSIDVWG